MKAIQKIVTTLAALFLFVGVAYGQDKKPIVDVDSLKSKAKQAIRIDTAKINKALAIDKKIKKTVNDKLNQSPVAKLLKKDSTLIGKKKIKLSK
ncbi:MAG: hypothetical protein REI93_07430 [Pedobacter sp.]|nr:hypothetical protein [Pedobacter sp.]